jgi:hypothetical protein
VVGRPTGLRRLVVVGLPGRFGRFLVVADVDNFFLVVAAAFAACTVGINTASSNETQHADKTSQTGRLAERSRREVIQPRYPSIVMIV